MRKSKVEFHMCPHCGAHTKQVPVREKVGTVNSAVLAFGVFGALLVLAFGVYGLVGALLGGRTKDSLLCGHCRTVFDIPRRHSPKPYLRVTLALLVLGSAITLILWLAY